MNSEATNEQPSPPELTRREENLLRALYDEGKLRAALNLFGATAGHMAFAFDNTINAEDEAARCRAETAALALAVSRLDRGSFAAARVAPPKQAVTYEHLRDTINLLSPEQLLQRVLISEGCDADGQAEFAGLRETAFGATLNADALVADNQLVLIIEEDCFTPTPI